MMRREQIVWIRSLYKKQQVLLLLELYIFVLIGAVQ